MNPVIAVIATLDTKADEAAFLAHELASRGCTPRIVDVGVRGDATQDQIAAVTASTVAAAAHEQVADLGQRVRRDHAMSAMATGAGAILGSWHHQGQLHGVLGVGGNQGTAVAAGAMRTLPFGLPKYLVSTVASGNVRGFVGDSDIVSAFSVGDLLGGPNAVTGTVLRQAAAAISAMASTGPYTPKKQRPLVAVTAFGNTHDAVTAVIDALRDAGVDTVPFHASGASGSAMEKFIRQGLFAGVLDLTTHELLAELYPEDIYCPVRTGRLTAAGEHAIPQVVLPGGLEYYCFAAAETIPDAMRDRTIHHHNPNNTNVRASAGELRHVAHEMARRLSAAAGPVTVIIPEKGWSHIGSPGGALHDPETNTEFVTELRAHLSEKVAVAHLPLTINDAQLACKAAEELVRLMSDTGTYPAQ